MNNLDEYSLIKLQDMAQKVDKNINIVKVDIFTNYCKVTYWDSQKESGIKKELRCPLYTSFEDAIAEITNNNNSNKWKNVYTSITESLKKIQAKMFQHTGNTLKEPSYSPPSTGSGITFGPSPKYKRPKVSGGYQPKGHIGNMQPPNNDSGIKSQLPKPKNRIPMPECKPPKETISDLDVLKELLTNPRVEGITINIDKVGEVSNVCINARIKEIPQVLKIDEKTLTKEDMEKLSSELKQSNLSIGSES